MAGRSKIIIYDDLLKDYKNINGWKPYESFPIAEIDDQNRKILEEIIVIEIQFEGANGKRHIIDPEKGVDIFDYNYMLFYNTVKRILAELKSTVYLLIKEGMAAQKSSVRTYKGLLDKSIKNEYEYLEIEAPVKPGYTILLSLLKLNNSSINDFESVVQKSSFCIIGSSDYNYFSNSFLADVASKYLTKNCIFINYMDLVMNYCTKGDIICRFGGDGGDSEISFQMFCKKNRKESLISFLQKTI